MAKLVFVALDGSEKTYRLQTHRPFTVGRDPGNDIILRDPKVSRHHAEIAFERGFFVLHDLASANGSYVNNKRVRVAPLIHGAQVRLGNTTGRFSEELPTEADGAAAEPAVFPPPQAVPAPDPQPANIDRFNVETLPHDKITEEELKKKVN
ncbi:MAG TPA: FHA domain-containing protein [Thermoanaerobaculia bacterium]|nr:FHA domain-containing protein [Thermoanaerobaculia bacterium]